VLTYLIFEAPLLPFESADDGHSAAILSELDTVVYWLGWETVEER
jgi:hypothetical protein